MHSSGGGVASSRRDGAGVSSPVLWAVVMGLGTGSTNRPGWLVFAKQELEGVSYARCEETDSESNLKRPERTCHSERDR